MLPRSTTANAYLYTFFLLEVCPMEVIEYPLDELHLKIQNLTLVSGNASGQANKSVRWLTSSAKALQHPQTLLLQATSLKQVIPSKSL